MFRHLTIYALTFSSLALSIPFQSAVASGSFEKSAHSDVLVTIKNGEKETLRYFDKLSETEDAVIGPVANTLQYFENAEGTKSYDKNCSVNLSKFVIQNTCRSSNSLNQISVMQKDSQSLFAFCAADNSGYCDNFIKACQNIGGGVSKSAGVGASCFVSVEVGERVSLHLQQEPDDGEVEAEGHNLSCWSVNACNDVIAVCAKNGADFKPTSYDTDTGAPSAGGCNYERDMN